VGKVILLFAWGCTRSIEAVVADIEDEALFGYDVLEGGSQGADILLSQNKIILDGIEKSLAFK
jgi:hypothetical protein